MIIHVTQKDINNGLPGKAASCPVALALNRATGQDWWVGNGDRGCTVLVPCQGHDYLAPRSVTLFRDRFDRGRPVKPFSFELTL